MTGKRKQAIPKSAAGGRAGGPTAAQKRLAAQRAMAAASGARTAQRRRLLTVLSPVAVVVLVAVILVAVKVASGSDKPKSGIRASAAGNSVVSAVTGVSASALNTVGKGSITTPPTTLNGAALTGDGGLPRVLFVGAEWCPYCAAERWPLAVALSRFGTLTGLGEVSSSPTDVYPNTATLTFHGASFSSTYLSVTAKEIFSNQVSGSSYEPLDTLSAADQKVYSADGNGFPFLDVGGRYLFSAGYDPAILKGLTQSQIAADLSNPSSPVAQAILGEANVITAAICKINGNKPAGVCSASGVTAAAALLPAGT